MCSRLIRQALHNSLCSLWLTNFKGTLATGCSLRSPLKWRDQSPASSIMTLPFTGSHSWYFSEMDSWESFLGHMDLYSIRDAEKKYAKKSFTFVNSLCLWLWLRCFRIAVSHKWQSGKDVISNAMQLFFKHSHKCVCVCEVVCGCTHSVFTADRIPQPSINVWRTAPLSFL